MQTSTFEVCGSSLNPRSQTRGQASNVCVPLAETASRHLCESAVASLVERIHRRQCMRHPLLWG